MVRQRTVEERLQMIEEHLLEIKSMLMPATIKENLATVHEVLMSVKEVAEMMKIDSAGVYALCKRNELPYIRLGKLYKFKKQDVLQWLSAQSGNSNNTVDDYVNRYLQKKLLKG